MKKRFTLLTIFVGISLAAAAQPIDVQNYRTYDGSQNNLSNPDWGAAGANLLLNGPVGYDNLISTPAGPNRPNPRAVSNSLFAQDGFLNDPLNLSDFCWVWGQFIDHDFGLTPDGNEDASIPVPQGDSWFDPFNTGQMVIPMKRNVFDPATGSTTLNPRRHPNMITAFIDGSGVYGSDEQRANWLRTFSGGKLKVSAGNLPPYNTYNGEFDTPIDPNAPHMDNPVGQFSKLFVCGDPRANENPVLLSFHTLFVREHNRLCDELAAKHPDWADEQLYQHARKLVGGLIQSVVYNEWLPTVGVELEPYEGYDPTINAQLFNVFTAAAFRLGHTLLSGRLIRVDNSGNELPEGPMMLRDIFFNPTPVVQHGIEPIIKGLAVQPQQQFDSKVVDDVRNFLFGPPGAGGLDLASININRGRERGLPDYNSLRDAFGLPRYQFFQQINPTPAVYIKLISLYDDINDIDPWVGFLAEQRMPGKLLGPTLLQILKAQFTNLRDGDRFFYLNDPVLSEDEKQWVHRNTLHDIIMRNTGVTLMQDNVFAAMPHAEICAHMTSDVAGVVRTESGLPVPNVTVSIMNNSTTQAEQQSALNGAFRFTAVPACDVTMVMPSKNDGVSNGVSTADLLFIARHILGVEPLDSPYKIIAADVDRNGAVTALDQIYIRKIILGAASEFPNNTSWRFVKADFAFQSANPLSEDFPEWATVENVLSLDMDVAFVAVKVGDVTGDANPSNIDSDALENRAVLAFQVADMELQAGEVYEIAFSAADINNIRGYQFSLQYDVQALEFLGIAQGALPDLSAENFGIFPQEGLITSSWFLAGEPRLSKGAPLFYLSFRALRNGSLSRLLSMNSSKTKAEAYNAFLESMGVGLEFTAGQLSAETPAFALHQNLPNPFSQATVIPFQMPADGWARLSVFDATGKLLLVKEGDFSAGYNEWSLKRSELAASGVLAYRLETENATATRRMILAD